MPKKISITLAFLRFSLLLLLPLLGAACMGGSPALGKVFQGPILGVTLVDIVSAPEMAYTEEDESHNLIAPATEENHLVLIHARIGNHAAEEVLMTIDKEPPELRTEAGQKYKAVNTIARAVQLDSHHPEENRFVPLIRGIQTLPKGNELEGWLVFDVPKDAKLKRFKWEAGGDIIIIDL